MTIGLIAGAFDIIHPGYIDMFEEAHNNCDILVIALHDDPTIERPEKLKPILSYDDRCKILSSIKYIDRIYPYDTEEDLINLIKTVKPDIRFLGDDYKGKKYTCDDLGIETFFFNRNHGWSTTKFKKLIYNQIKQKK